MLLNSSGIDGPSGASGDDGLATEPDFIEDWRKPFEDPFRGIVLGSMQRDEFVLAHNLGYFGMHPLKFDYLSAMTLKALSKLDVTLAAEVAPLMSQLRRLDHQNDDTRCQLLHQRRAVLQSCADVLSRETHYFFGHSKSDLEALLRLIAEYSGTEGDPEKMGVMFWPGSGCVNKKDEARIRNRVYD